MDNNVIPLGGANPIINKNAIGALGSPLGPPLGTDGIIPRCLNCNGFGHTIKNCIHPNVSIGIILFRFNKMQVEYLLISRKESYAMGEFISERYILHNIPAMMTMFNNMTVYERELIRNKSILELEEIFRPKVYFTNKSMCNKNYVKYEKLQKGYEVKGVYYSLEYFLTNATKKYTDPEWGFPKGKKGTNESDIKCAIREFYEETNFVQDDYTILSQVPPIIENLIGENKRVYKYYYYLGMLVNYDRKLELQESNWNQRFEVSKMEWMTAKEANEKIRDYYPMRKEIINYIDKKIKEEFFGL